MAEVKIPYGVKTLSLNVPDKNLALVFDPPFPSPISDLSAAILRALDRAGGGPSFLRPDRRGERKS